MQTVVKTPDSQRHWRELYAAKPGTTLSWYQQIPDTSLSLIKNAGVKKTARIIDIGGGTARLVDVLLEKGYRDITVLDIAENALARTKARLGKETAAKIKWINADITRWQPQREYDLWHDRAVFHFLIRDTDVEVYKRALLQGLKPGGHLVIGTFAPEGPDHCSGLPVRRYSSDSLAEKLGHEFELVQSLTEDHTTPAGILQRFLFCRFTRVA